MDDKEKKVVTEEKGSEIRNTTVNADREEEGQGIDYEIVIRSGD